MALRADLLFSAGTLMLLHLRVWPFWSVSDHLEVSLSILIQPVMQFSRFNLQGLRSCLFGPIKYDRTYRSTKIFAIDFSSKDPWSAFVQIIEIEGSREFYVFKGSEIVTRDTDSDLSFWDIHVPEYEVKLMNPAHVEVSCCISTCRL